MSGQLNPLSVGGPVGTNILNGCGCGGSTASAARTGANTPTWLQNLVFQDAPIATVGVSFSNAELLRAALFMAGAVFIGSYFSTKLTKR